MKELSQFDKTTIRDFENKVVTAFKKNEEIPYVIRIGSYVYKTYGDFRIFEVVDIENKPESRPDWDKDGEESKYINIILKPIISTVYDSITDVLNTTFESLATIEREYTVSNRGDINDLKEIAQKVMNREISIESINDFKLESVASSTDIMIVKSQEYYETMLNSVREAKNKVAIIQGLITREVEKIQYQIRALSDDLQKTVKKLNKIVFTLTIYAGLTENVIQISEGVFAPIDEPINLQQEMLFMDEEVGDPDHGGISFDTVQKFYDWLEGYNIHLGYKNYELVLPYQKCVTLMRVRREVSDKYTNRRDIWGNQWFIQQEMKTCMLIRNGENVYAIHSDMHFSTKLFPNQEEFATLIEKIKKDNWDAEKAEDKLEQYKNGMVLIQGLFDRTNLLTPPGAINIMNGTDLNNGKVIFNYNKVTLEDSADKSKTFFRWLDAKSIKEGNRIMFNGFGRGETHKDRIVKYFRDGNYPYSPERGKIYSVEKYEGNRLSFLYLPTDEIWSNAKRTFGKRERKERVIIYPEYDRLINVDDFSHRDYDYINNLMYNRKYRKSYLWLVPLLSRLKKLVEETREQEEPFGALIKREFPHISNETIQDYIFWWKTKNKWKRSLSVDDIKALRMIKSKLKKDILEKSMLEFSSFFNSAE